MSVLDKYSPVGTFRRRGDDGRKQQALPALSLYNVSRGANSPPYPCASPLQQSKAAYKDTSLKIRKSV